MSTVRDELVPDIIDALEGMYPEAACALDHKSVYELIVAVVLSAQTTDVSVNRVTPALFMRYPDPASLASADPSDVEDLIRTIGLYRNKSRSIIKLASMLVREYGGEVPGRYEDLIRLPGVGRKTANVVLAEGFGIPAIAVDTHVFRVSNRIGLTDAPDVTATEEGLMERLPRDRWIRTHHLLIFHGRRCCHARKPECSRCSVSSMCLYIGKS